MATRIEVINKWQDRLEQCSELGDERGMKLCRVFLEDLQSIDGDAEASGYWSVSETSSFTGLSDAQIRKLIHLDTNDEDERASPFPGAVQRSRRWLIPAHEVVAYMEDGEPETTGRVPVACP